MARALGWGAQTWGILLGFWLFAPFVLNPENLERAHAGVLNVAIVREFADILATGTWVPQWSTYSHGGLGGPFFHFYQPLFWYPCAFLSKVLPIRQAFGVVLFCFAVWGYTGMRRLFPSRGAGVFAGSVFLLSPYVFTEICVRGDYSQFAAMMMVPWSIRWQREWLERPSFQALGWASFSSAAIALLHPCVGLPFFISMAVEAVWSKRIIHGGLAILTAAFLTSVYSLPLFWEWSWVTPERAFRGALAYEKSFVSPRLWLGGFSNPAFSVPVTLGVGGIFLTVFSLLNRQPDDLWRGYALRTAGLFLFLMTPASSHIWALLPLLQKIQFPWRLFSLVTPALAILAPQALLWVPRKARLGVGVAILLGLLAASDSYRQFLPRGIFYVLPDLTTAASLQDYAYNPDVYSEWTPRGAKRLVGAEVPREPSLIGGDCRWREFKKRQQRMSLHITTSKGCALQLPQYAYPDGWKVFPLALAHLATSNEGLLKVQVAEGFSGEIELVFRMTKSKRVGLALSVGTAILLWVGGWLEVRGRPRTSGRTLRLRLANR